MSYIPNPHPTLATPAPNGQPRVDFLAWFNEGFVVTDGHLLANPANPDGAFYYVAGPQKVDWAERARRIAEKQFREEVGDKFDMSGYFFPVKKVWRGR